METPPPFENDRYATPPSEPEPKLNTQPRKWYRFTLWKMVVAFVLLGVVFAYLRYTHWGYVLSENIARVGRSFGLVEQRDPNKIYVSAVRPLGRDNWEWIVELPPGELYSVCYKDARIPVSGVPDGIGGHFSQVPWSYSYLIDFHVEYIGWQLGRKKIFTTSTAIVLLPSRREGDGDSHRKSIGFIGTSSVLQLNQKMANSLLMSERRSSCFGNGPPIPIRRTRLGQPTKRAS